MLISYENTKSNAIFELQSYKNCVWVAVNVLIMYRVAKLRMLVDYISGTNRHRALGNKILNKIGPGKYLENTARGLTTRVNRKLQFSLHQNLHCRTGSNGF